eukprot:gene319-410_t
MQVHEDVLNKEQTICLINGDYTGISFPIIFKQVYGKKLQDMLDTGWPGLFLISDRMKSVLEENQLTGWKTFSVQVFDKKGEGIPGYHGFSITGRCGEIDYSKSPIIEKRRVPDGPLVKFYKVITQRAAEILKKNKLTNIDLENLSDLEMSGAKRLPMPLYGTRTSCDTLPIPHNSPIINLVAFNLVKVGNAYILDHVAMSDKKRALLRMVVLHIPMHLRMRLFRQCSGILRLRGEPYVKLANIQDQDKVHPFQLSLGIGFDVEDPYGFFVGFSYHHELINAIQANRP